MSTGYVYIIDPHVQIDGRPVVKIGMTKGDPRRRLKQLQTSLPTKASLAHAVRFPDAKGAEKILHRGLDGRRVRSDGGTEFFFISPREAIDVVNQLAYQVSAYEAERALERELDNFIERVSNAFMWKVASWLMITCLYGIVLYYITQQEGRSQSTILDVLALVSFWLWVFVGVAAQVICDAVIRAIWRREIEAERNRLLKKYPAARDPS